MTAEQIIDHIRSHPDHPPTISTAEWAAVVKAYDTQQAEIQRQKSTIAQLLDEKKQAPSPD